MSRKINAMLGYLAAYWPYASLYMIRESFVKKSVSSSVRDHRERSREVRNRTLVWIANLGLISLDLHGEKI